MTTKHAPIAIRPGMPATAERKSALERAVEARGEAIFTFPVSGFFGLGDKPILHIGFRMQGSIDDDGAVIAAQEYIEALIRGSGEAGTRAASDPDLLDNAKMVEALWRCTRDVEEDPPGSGQWKPTGYDAFMGGPKWMRKHLTKRELAILFDLLGEAKRLDGIKRGVVEDIDDAAVEAVAKMCAEHVGDDIPEAMLAGVSRPNLTHLVVLLAAKLADARMSVETLLAEQEALEELPPGPSEDAEPVVSSGP